MAKINRFSGNLQAFASAALGTERTIFGGVTQSDDLTSQITASFLRGWGIVGPSDSPSLEDFNAAMYTHGQLLAYLHQVGVPEYNAAQEYHQGSISNLGGDLYVSLINSNVGNAPATSPSSWRSTSASSSTVGESRNLRAALGAAATSISFTADEIIVKRAIGGQSWIISSVSNILNVATVGAGGMDTGAAPVSGYVAIYAIYNPTTGAKALLGQNATASAAPSVYVGANMPAGYVGSALISVWPTNGSQQLVIGMQSGRDIGIANNVVLTTSTQQASLTSLSISGAVPRNAVSVRGDFTIGTSIAGEGCGGVISGSAVEVGRCAIGATSPTANATVVGSFPDINLFSQQTVYYRATTSGGTLNFLITIAGYSI